MEVKRILLIRHGESLSNKQHMLSGRGNSDLSRSGTAQARKLSRFIRKKFSPIDRIYSSPLERALSTARELSRKLKTPVETNELLVETDFGRWEGMTHEMLKCQPEWERYLSDPFHFSFPGGESPQDVKRRVLLFREQLLGEDSWSTVVVVSHYTPIVFLTLSVLGDAQCMDAQCRDAQSMDAQSTRAPFRIDNASITVIERSGDRDYIGMMNFTP